MRRSIKQIFHGEPVTEGAGVKLRRVFGYYETPMFDPFLMLDDFRSDTPDDFRKGFPWHPHRGIETITYVIRGDVEHGDSLGNTGVISGGDVQWMTAGSGIIHQEMPKGDAQGAMYGFQLWANLPAAQKMMQPRYRDITAVDIPVITTQQNVEMRIIAGTVDDVRGPADDIVIDPEFFDCTIPDGVEFIHPTHSEYTAFIYVIDGSGSVNDTRVHNRDLVLFSKGDELAVSAVGGPLRLLLLTGKPLGEPVAWRGPIVMNSKEELDLAFAELKTESFIKYKQGH